MLDGCLFLHCPTGADLILNLVEAVVSEDKGSCLQLITQVQRETRFYDKNMWLIFCRTVCMHGPAFDRGFLPLSRLMEVAVAPFLKLSAKLQQRRGRESPSPLLSARHGTVLEFTSMMEDAWRRGIAQILDGETILTAEGGGRFDPLVTMKSRGKIVQELLKKGFLQVLLS